jgi:hypothetical protein
MKDLTPESMRCAAGYCPAVYDLGDGRLLIVGEFAHMCPPGTAAGNLYEDLCNGKGMRESEVAITIDKALLANVVSETVAALEAKAALLGATVTSMQREIDALREALKPFAKAGELFGDKHPGLDSMTIYAPSAGEEYWLESDDLRRARAALSETPHN